MSLQGCFKCSGWLNMSSFMRQWILDRITFHFVTIILSLSLSLFLIFFLTLCLSFRNCFPSDVTCRDFASLCPIFLTQVTHDWMYSLITLFSAEHTRRQWESSEADAAEATVGNRGSLPEAVSPAVFLRQVWKSHVGIAQRLQLCHCLHTWQQRIHRWLHCSVLNAYFV